MRTLVVKGRSREEEEAEGAVENTEEEIALVEEEANNRLL